MASQSVALQELLLQYTDSCRPADSRLKQLLERASASERFVLVKGVREHGKKHAVMVASWIRDLEGLKCMITGFSQSQKYDVMILRDARGLTPLHLAVFSRASYETAYTAMDMIKYLLADLSNEQRLSLMKLQDSYGDTVLHFAGTQNIPAVLHMISLLKNHEYDELIGIRNKGGLSVADRLLPLLLSTVQDTAEHKTQLSKLLQAMPQYQMSLREQQRESEAHKLDVSMQRQEINQQRHELSEQTTELSKLKEENLELRKDLADLRSDIIEMRRQLTQRTEYRKHTGEFTKHEKQISDQKTELGELQQIVQETRAELTIYGGQLMEHNAGLATQEKKLLEQKAATAELKMETMKQKMDSSKHQKAISQQEAVLVRQQKELWSCNTKLAQQQEDITEYSNKLIAQHQEIREQKQDVDKQHKELEEVKRKQLQLCNTAMRLQEQQKEMTEHLHRLEHYLRSPMCTDEFGDQEHAKSA